MKEIIKTIKVQLDSGKATAVPPLGPLLSQNNINPNLFIKAFNEKTAKDNVKHSVLIFIFNDKTFDFKLLSSPIPMLILEALNLKKGSSSSKNIIHTMNKDDLDKIMEKKKKDFPRLSNKSLESMILGTAKNMGIDFK